MSIWSELLPELLQTITQKQTNYVDFLSIRSVCKSWRSAIPKKPHDLTSNLPWLLLPYHENFPDHRGFYNLSNGKTYFLESTVTHEKRCCGSSHGWLIMVENTPAIFLLNPLTKSRIELPSLSTFPNFPTEVVYQNSRKLNEYFIRNDKIRIRETYMRKAIISEDPATVTNFTVMAIYKTVNDGENLAFCTSGDLAWSTIPETSHAPHYRDILFSSGKFFAVDDKGRVVSVRTTENPVSIFHFADPPPVPPTLGYKQWYLGTLNNDLLLIGRFRKYRIPDYGYQTINFMVCKLNMSESKATWSELDSLGDRIFFLGWNSFHSISSFHDDHFRNSRGNFIYFTDDHMKVYESNTWEGHDFGIFDLENRSVSRLGLPLYPINLPPFWNIYYDERSLRRDRKVFVLPPPVWVTINPGI